MFQINCLNKIAAIGTSRFGDNYNVGTEVANPDAIMVRSAAMHEMEFNDNLLAIARAGAGTNNIPIDRCSESGIVVFNTPGANANAVKELVLAGLLLASRKVVPGIAWAKSLKGNGDQVGKMVEKGKSNYVGPELMGKTLGVVGLGAIGALVANAAIALGMKVVGYDPFLSVNAALHLNPSVTVVATLDEIYAQADYVTLHLPLTPDTKGMINAESIAKMKDGVRIVNFARGDLANSTELIAALNNGKVAAYVTDFPSDDLLDVENVVPIPHLGASTPESEDNCAVMAADELKDYLENGNITNSVNFPNVSMPREHGHRICILHKNIPNMLSQLTAVVGDQGLNIENMQSKSKKDMAYALVDIDGEITDASVAAITAVEGVVRVRVIK